MLVAGADAVAGATPDALDALAAGVAPDASAGDDADEDEVDDAGASEGAFACDFAPPPHATTSVTIEASATDVAGDVRRRVTWGRSSAWSRPCTSRRWASCGT
jgi:hypothetical protein